MAARHELKFPNLIERQHLRPSRIPELIANRNWVAKSLFEELVKAAFSCTDHQAWALIVIAQGNGLVESKYEKRHGWQYRVLDTNEVSELPTTFSPVTDYKKYNETDEMDDPF